MDKGDRVKDKLEKKKQEEWEAKIEHAKKHNEVLIMWMTLSTTKMKDKNGIWVSKPSFSLMFKNLKKLSNDPTSLFGKAANMLRREKDSEEAIKQAEAKFKKENEELKEQSDSYAKMLTFTTKKIINHIIYVKDGIDTIEENFKGLFSTRDQQLIRMITDAGDKAKKHVPIDSKTIISDLKRELSDANNQLKQIRIVSTELESELLRYKKKDHALRSKVTKLGLELDETKHGYEMRINEYKSIIHSKDEEITSIKEHNRSQEKLTREYASKTNSSSYELESTKKKLGESKHHQDMLTKRLREYEDIVRVLNKSMKQTTTESAESSKNSKLNEHKIDVYKTKNKVLEEELHKREGLVLNCKAVIKKLQTQSNHQDQELDKLRVQGKFEDDSHG